MRHFTKMSPATSYNVNKNKVEKLVMGSKKLKRKKLKCKKLEKCRKIKRKKSKKKILFESSKETDCGGNLLDKNVGVRLSPKKCSRSYINDGNISDVKYFAKVREDYFRNLQTVVCNNCEFFDSTLSEEVLENLALQLEQNAILECLQVEIYKRSMLNIIEAINKSTLEKQLYTDVKKYLSESFQEKTHQINTPQSAANSLEVESYSKIPTIAFSRNEDNLNANNYWTDELPYNAETYYSVGNNCEEAFNADPYKNSNDQAWGEDNLILSQPNNWDHESPQISDLRISENVAPSHSTISQKNLYVQNNSLSQNEETDENIDPLSLSRSQLQKLVEQTLMETEKVNKLKRDEQERACIAQILEGDDSLDERFNDSLSDNENDSKENIDESNLMDRLEKMRELFGMEDGESQTEITLEKPKQNYKVTHAHFRNRRPTIWRYEKFIQLHKYSVIAGEMSVERRQINQKLFIELFGEDSDEEHEAEFSSTEKYRSSCTERISSWVVKYLMPYYHEKRILGRNVFKSLGHYISDTIVDEIQYPDEWTVKYFVSKFFPPKKKYVCEADILSFQLE